MTHQNLVEQINIIRERESDPDFIRTMRMNIMANTSKQQFDNAVSYLQQGISIYQTQNNAARALELIENSLTTFKTPEAYYNKGVIYMQQENAYECFRAQTSSILLAGDDSPVPPSFHYRAISLLVLMDSSSPTNQSDKNTILDFIIKDLRTAISLGEQNASRMLNDMTELRR